MIEYKTNKDLEAKKLFDLYESVEWTKNIKEKEQHADFLAQVYENSDGVHSAWEGAELVGVVRFITDTMAHSMIYGLAVNPSHQNAGIASELIKRCIETYPETDWKAEVEDENMLDLFEKNGFSKSDSVHVTFGSSNV